MPYLATISIGEDLIILSDLASTDLDRFLRNCPPILPGIADLINHIATIAGALKFLHEGLQLPGRAVACYHMDLKPDNVLVFSNKYDLLGVWKISDFGISTVKENAARPRESEIVSDEFNTVGELVRRFRLTSGLPPKRGPRPYQAPEVDGSGESHVGTKSDVWSFGCIFVEVLAFALEGSSLVEDLENKRGMTTDLKSGYLNDYYHRDGTLNPHIRNWLIEFQKYDKVDSIILENCQTLAFEMLEISPVNRPSSSEVYERLVNYKQRSKCSRTNYIAKRFSSEEEEKQKKMIQTFRNSQYESHKERNPDLVQGTCQWVLQHNLYNNWRNTSFSSLLWISADPGCGKSVLSKFLVNAELKASETRKTCYFFFKDDNDEQKTAANALCGLLHQLFSQEPRLSKYAESFLKANGEHLKTNFHLLWEILVVVSGDPDAGEIICTLDALDECTSSDRKVLLQKLCDFYREFSESEGKNTSNLKFLVTSRAYQDIEMEFNDLKYYIPMIHLSGEEETATITIEIDLVIKAEIEKIRKKMRLDNSTIASLAAEFSKVKHRTYLWLKLVLDLIYRDAGYVTKRGREEIFYAIPDSVDAAYTAILDRSTNKKLARRLLSITCTATRSLTVKEMMIALTIEGEHRTYEDLEIQSDDFSKSLIRNLCGLFVSIINGRVFLLHQTVKEYLMPHEYILSQAPRCTWKYSIIPEESNLLLANICIWYLRLLQFDTTDGLKAGLDVEISLLRTKPATDEHEFLEYSAKNWAVHFRAAKIRLDHSSVDLALEILYIASQRHQAWFSEYWHDKPGKLLPIGMTILHLASMLGLDALVERQLTTEVEVNAVDGMGNTPLLWAVDQGRGSAVTKLLGTSSIDINKPDRVGRSPLWLAVFKLYEDITNTLLSMPEVDVNKPNNGGVTPLLRAVTSGSAKIAALLLAMPDIDVNKPDDSGLTPLWQAIIGGHPEIVHQLLLVPGVEVDKPDRILGVSPLQYAITQYRLRAGGYSRIIANLKAAGASLVHGDTNMAYKESFDSEESSMIAELGRGTTSVYH